MRMHKLILETVTLPWSICIWVSFVILRLNNRTHIWHAFFFFLVQNVKITFAMVCCQANDAINWDSTTKNMSSFPFAFLRIGCWSFIYSTFCFSSMPQSLEVIQGDRRFCVCGILENRLNVFAIHLYSLNEFDRFLKSAKLLSGKSTADDKQM